MTMVGTDLLFKRDGQKNGSYHEPTIDGCVSNMRS